MIGPSVGYILMGSPGAGKGTIGQYLSETCDVEHFSSGDLLRAEVSARTAIGNEIKETIDLGKQVSDDLITGLVLDRIKMLTAQGKSFALDGFPQTLLQENELNQFAKLSLLEIKYICVTVSPETALERMVNRVTCSVCNTIFSKLNNTIEKCAKCSGKLVVRKSDNREIARERLKQFQITTKQVMEDVQEHFHPIIIDGNGSVEEIRTHLFEHIKDLRK